MARISLPKLFRKMAFKPDRKRGFRSFPLYVEDIEERIAPATLPQPTLVTPTAATASTAAGGFSPQVIADPADSTAQRQVLVAMTATGVLAQTTTNGGSSWSAVAGFGATRLDPNTNANYPNTSAPSVAFGRDGTLYFVYLSHNADKSSGMVMFQKATFGGAVTSTIRLYQWFGADPALNPVIAVDNNLPTDPVSATTDTMINSGTLKSKGVYIAWNGNATPVAQDLVAPNANPIMATVSGDDGATWSQPTPVSSGGYLSGAGGAAPQIIFSPANSGAPGSLIFVWPQLGGAIVYDSSRPDSGLAGDIVRQSYTYIAPVLTIATGAIPDAVQPPSSPPPPPGTPDITSTQSFNLTVPAGTIPTVGSPAFSLADLQVEIQLVSPQLDHLRIRLQGPNGTITLLNNRIDGLGNTNPGVVQSSGVTFTPGLPPPPQPASNYQGLGVINGNLNPVSSSANPNTIISQAVFGNQGSRKINDPNTRFPYIGYFRPESGSSLLNVLSAGSGPAAINGAAFTLIVEDFRDDRYTDANSNPYDAPQFLRSWGLTFSSLNPTTNFGSDTGSGLTGTTIGADPYVAPGSPNKPTISPTVGIPGSISLAFDQTLGNGAGANGGQMYLAFTTGTGSDTNVAVSRASVVGGGIIGFGAPIKVNDDRLADNYTEGDRAQFIPAVTVDNYTGTVVATWYDARLDAANMRAATFVATSLDGGATWSDQTYNTAATSSTAGVSPLPFLSQPKIALDVITNRNYTLQPVPSNIPQAGANGVGIRQSVIAAAGHIYAYWGGNSNAAGTSVMSAHAVTAVGPRITGGSMGTVTTLSSFDVTFDRLMGPVTTASAELRYHNPYEIATTFTNIPITGVSQIGAASYRFSFAPQTDVGTYSYVVRPTLLLDTVQHLVGGVPTLGNTMDQDSDSVSGEIDVDSFAMPTPTNGIPFQFPFSSNTLPLMISGPRQSGSSVFGYGNSLVLGNNAATTIDVTFDQPMNQNPAFGPVFTAANIIRMTGPTGVIFDRATAAVNPMIVTPLTPTSYRITYPTQVLSGTYTIEIDPLSLVSTTLLPGGANRYAYLDTNRNAGLDVLRGGSPTSGIPSDSVYNGTFNAATTPTATIPAASGAVPSMKEYPITVPDSYIIALSAGHQIEVQLNVSSTIADNTSVLDLSGELVAPDGTVIRLFTNVGNGTRPPGTLWFSNTLFNDTGNTPIQVGFQPFDSGPYNPQFPLGNLAGMNSNGLWRLRIFNEGTHTPDLNGWSLSLPQISGGTGLGEANADRFAVSFRIFNQDPTSALTQDVWTAVGPAPENGPGGNTARMNAFAVDPSDPSGNTVYVGAASGGLWKTNNFLTQDAIGPTYVPMGDSAPAFGLNVVSIAVFPRNNDPLQSIIFALTGEGDTGTPGVGVLRSMDGGRTWNVLDSTNNSDSSIIGSGVITSISSPSRDRAFFGNATGYKIVVDPTAVNNADKDVIVYMARGDGVWRSTDTGRHWTRLKQGHATDVVLAEGSAAKVGNPNLQIVYAAFRGDGIYMANPAYVAAGMVLMSGVPGGNGSFIQIDDPLQPRVTISQPIDNPNGNNGKHRTLLATPALTKNAVQDLNYQGWLYALVVAPNGGLDGLYITKDFGQNWTSISLAERLVLPNGYGTNNYTRADHDVFASPPGTSNPLPGQGRYDVAFAIDPNNPNVVYLGGMTQSAAPPNGGLIRVDITGLQDAQAIVAYDNSSTLPAGGPVQFTANAGNINVKNAGSAYSVSTLSGVNRGYLNVLRNPSGPFATSNVLFTNVTNINNKGWGARYAGFGTPGEAEIQTDIHRIVTVRDQVTGKTRLIVEDDQGIGTAVDDGSGNILYGIGNYAMPGKNRNGNLQIIQFYSSTVHPGQLAAEIASAMFYGEGQDDGFPVSSDNILQTGGGAQLSWSGGAGDGSWGLTDQTGSGTYYDYRWPCCGGNNSNFFRVNGVSRTFGLLQSGDNPTQNQGQWPYNAGFKFAVNPIDRNGLMISNGTGRIFRTVDQGVTWFVVADPVLPGYTSVGSYAQALAFGSPDPIFPDQFNNYLLAGTAGGQVWVTYTGGSPWTNISAGLSGGSVQQIIPDPTRGSRAAYAVTSGGVFWKADTTPGAAAWVNVTGNLFTQSKPIFDEANPSPQNGAPAMIRNLTSLAVDWSYAIPDQINPARGSFPVLYAGGYGGVVRSLDRGATWQTYPVGTTYTYTDPITGLPSTITTPDGGYFPSAEVTQLTLSQGNIDPATGQPIQQTGGLNMLTAGTYGRGTWVIRLGTPDNDPAIAAITQYQVVKQGGPRVIAVTPTASTPTQNTIRVQFDSPVLASTFTNIPADGDIQIRGSDGALFTINSVTPILDTAGPFAPYRVAIPTGVTVGDYHDVFDIVVTRPGSYAPFPGGFAEITIGEKIYDYAGFGMNQDDDFLNGEQANDPDNGGAHEDAYRGYVVLSAAAPLGNLHIDQPMVTTAGEPTRVVISSMNPANGRPLATYTGIISLDATVNGRHAVLTNLPVFQIKDLTDNGAGNVTATTLVPLSADIIPGRRILIGGVGTAVYNTTNPDGDVVVSVAADRLSFVYRNLTAAGAAPDRSGGGNVVGPYEPVAANTPSPAPYPGGLLPNTYQFTASDAGTHVFAVFYIGASSPPSQTMFSVKDITGGTATFSNNTALSVPDGPGGSAESQIVVPAAASRVISGLTVNMTVSAARDSDVRAFLRDPSGLVRVPLVLNRGGTGSNFTNTTFSDSGADSIAAGFANFNGTFRPESSLEAFNSLARGGTWTLELYDDAAGNAVTLQNWSLTITLGTTNGARDFITVEANKARQFVLQGVSPVTAGDTHTWTLKAVDQYGNIDTNYTGTVTITSDDPLASFAPTPYTFTSLDAGVKTIDVTLRTAGLITVTATDDVTNAPAIITGGHTVRVMPAVPTTITVSGFPNPTVAGVAHDYTVKLFDVFGNLATNYAGTVTMTNTDLYLAIFPHFTPASYTFTAYDEYTPAVEDAGTHTFTNGATLYTAGTRSIIVRDNSLNIQGAQIGITVNPAPMSQFVVSGFPSPTAAGTSKNFTVRAADPYGNRISGYTGKITLSTSDPQGSFVPASGIYTFTVGDAGQHTFSGNLKTAGLQSITARDFITPLTLNGTQSNILITPLAANSVQVTGLPSPRVAGTDGDFTVTFRDIYNNIATGFTGLATFSTNDPFPGTFSPSSWTFTAVDAGQKTFTNGVNLKTTGTWFIRSTSAGGLIGTQSGIVVTPAAATVAIVTGHTSPIVAGTPSNFTVELKDPFGNRDTNYAGTMTFSSTDPFPASFSPPNYTFTGGDAGIHTFVGGSTLKTTGTWSITATQGAITGSQTGIVVNPNVATHFDVAGFLSPTTAGVAHNFTVTARDAYGNVATGYLGTVAFTSTDPLAVLPTNHTFTSGEAGVFTGSATLKKAGTRSITATDTLTASITGTQTPILVNPAATSQFIMDFPTLVGAGTQHPFTVTAADPYGNPTPTYTGTVTLSSSDGQAIFGPPILVNAFNEVNFTSGDNGVVSLTGELRTAGSQSITADDGLLSGTQTGITVTPDVATHADVTGFPDTVAGVAHNFTVTMRDQFENVATGYLGTMTFLSNDTQASFLPTSHTFTAGDAGIYVASATLRTAGTANRSITATDGGTISGTQTLITVVAAAASTVSVSGFQDPTVAGVAHDFTVTLFDPFSNVATGFLGTMLFSSDDPQASFLMPSYTFNGGDAGTHFFASGATLRTVGSRYIRGTSGSLVGEQTSIDVTPAATSKFVVEGFQSPITAGVSDVFTVRATDAFDNTTPGYTGTATLTSSDGQAIFTPSATLVFSGANFGVRTVTGELRTAGPQSITATAGALTGSQTGIQVLAAAATSVTLAGFTSPITAGVGSTFTVTLRDPFNNVATGYTGTMTFSSSDPQATFVPTSHTFIATDAGVFMGGGTLRTAGTQSITANDGSISGSQTNITVNPAAMSQFVVEGFQSPITAGVSDTFTVRAADPFGNTTPTYLGSVTLSSNDPQATFSLSNPIAFTAGNFGSRSLTGTLRTSGTRSISATDGTFSGAQNGIVVNSAAPASVVVSGVPSPTTAGVARTFTVSIRDAFNNVATGYVGTMTFSSSDPQVVFAPTSWAFAAGDAGQRTFSNGVTLRTAGTQTVVATDSVNSLVGTQNVTVTPAAASQVIVSGFPGTTTAGDAHDVTVTLRDPFNNVATGYTGTVTLTSSDPQAAFAPPNHTFTGGDAGTFTFTNGATLKTAGTQSITAGDGAISGSQVGIIVNPAATSQFLTDYPVSTVAGTSHGFTLRAADPYGNTTPGYTGTATLSSSDPQVVFSSTTVPFTISDNGAKPGLTGTLKTSGSQSISATDGTFSGTQSGIIVNAAAAATATVSGFPSSTVAGIAHDFTVTLFDPFGNVATGYTGTMSFTSNDPQAAFVPTSYAFTGGDAGTHTFTNGATLKTAGVRNIVASDGAITGTQSNITVNSAAATSLNITGFPNTVRATDDQAFTVTARDAFGNPAAGYTGTVVFTSTDVFGLFIPNPYTFTGGDAGAHVFTGNFSTNGLQSFTVTDTGTSTLTATRSNIAVTPGPVASFTLTGAPALSNGRDPFPLTVRALDRFGRPLTTYNGAVNFTSSDPYAVLPTGLTLVNGVAVANFTLFTPAVRSITVRDSVNAAATGTVNVNVFSSPMQPAVVTQRFGVGAGRGPGLNLYEADGTFIRTYNPFGPGFTGGIRTVVADFNLDGVPDVVAGSGPGIVVQVKVFDGVTNSVIFDIQPFADFTGGVFVSAGAITGDGFPDLIVTPDQGGGPRVSIFHGGTFNKFADFFGIEDKDFRGGARASAGDFNGDGTADIIVSAGFLGGPRISIFDGAALKNGLFAHPVGDFYAFDQSLRDGAYVAAGDVNGDGFADAIFGAGPGGGPRTTIVNGPALLANPQNAIDHPIATFFTGDYTKRGGIREAVKNIDGDRYADLLVGDGEDVGSSIRIYLGESLKDGGIGREFSLRAFPEVNAGVYVG